MSRLGLGERGRLSLGDSERERDLLRLKEGLRLLERDLVRVLVRERFLGGGVRERERRGVSVRLVREMDRLQDRLGVLERDLVNFLLFRGGVRLRERRGVRLRLRVLDRGVRERGERRGRDRERDRERVYDRDRGLL